MKRIYIYLPDDGFEYSGGARSELSETENGNVFAFVSSPCINKIWRAFNREVASHSLMKRKKSASQLLGCLEVMLLRNERVSYVCYRKISRKTWARTERCIVGIEAVHEVMREGQLDRSKEFKNKELKK